MTIAVLATAAVPSAAEVPSSTEACPPAVAEADAPSAASTQAPTPVDPEQLVACVGSQPITDAAVSHWTSVAEKSEPPATGTPSAGHATEVRNEVMAFLISSYWLIGEAKDLAIHISPLTVRHSFDRIRREQFPKHGEFAAFLRSSAQTVADLLFRERLALTSGRIQKHVLSGRHGARSRAHALAHFVETFKAKWRGQTYCAALYAVSDCGHIDSAL